MSGILLTVIFFSTHDTNASCSVTLLFLIMIGGQSYQQKVVSQPDVHWYKPDKYYKRSENRGQLDPPSSIPSLKL